MGFMAPLCLTIDQQKVLTEFTTLLTREGFNGLYTIEGQSTSIRFLRPKHFDIPQARRKFLDYVSWYKQTNPHEITIDRAMEVEFLKEKFHFLGYDLEGRPVALVRSGLHIASESPCDLVLRCMLCILEYFTHIVEINVEEFVLILDQQGMTLKSIDPALEKNVLTTISKYYPERIGAVYIINTPTFIHSIFNLIKNFLSKRYFQRIHFLSKPSDLLARVPSTILPKEYGGYRDMDYKLSAIDLVDKLQSMPPSAQPAWTL
eukprot:NODE_4910_length_1096_cov_72.633094_g4362_i0.p1 GENE.NODE_4910_length_1096_cov_72.633094_g4362_i0~~NODE_4910_length_1096_cov_72.633094_g4362_i0.p1  ORF type:complete len:261 (+),score=26.10 NODE_4910_length_1096_cov_72.633094_g4362_i0:60-842(+)